MFLSTILAGTLIGSGGSLIKELMEITGAAVHVSSAGHFYPGTELRCVYITGAEESVNEAQSLIWEMVGQQTFAQREGNRSLAWHPAVAKSSPGEYDKERVEAAISVPAAAGGIIVGKRGSGIRELIEQSGAELFMDSREAAEVTGERMITIKGTVGSCMNCTFLVLSKLTTLDDDYAYMINGTSYRNAAVPTSASRAREFSRIVHADSDSRNNSGHSAAAASAAISSSGRTRCDSSSGELDLAILQTLSALTTFELAVPDRAIGALLGPQGTRLEEMQELSGAKIVISRRGEFIEGTTNRKVTIVGTPACAQAAHTLVVQKLRQHIQDSE